MPGVLERIRKQVRGGGYVLTYHAIAEMTEDGFEETDFERAVARGRIVRRQRDRLGRRKYTVEGGTRQGRLLRAVCRFSEGGGSLVVITIYEAIR